MKGFLLTVVSFLLIVLVLNAGYYREWFQAKPVQYWTDFLKEKDDTLDAVGIMKSRYGISYVISTRVKEVVGKKNIVNPVILFEPNSYYRDSLHIYPNVRAPEPAVFYYYTGLVGVWTNSPNVSNANFLVRVTKKGVALDAIRTPQQLQQILANYKKFTPIL
ncbi:MAG TPA: hypothetical protein VG052_10150 [Puia sp.]|nr:hypothetical protein [Puia sp.]